MLLWLALNSDQLVSVSQVLGLEVYATTPGIFIYYLCALYTHTLTDSKQ